MNVTVENLAPCRKLVRIDIDAQEVEKGFVKATTKYQKGVKLPGFRPGKAPPDIVVKTYSKEIDEEAKRLLITDHYRRAIKDNNINVIGYPDIEEIQFARGEPLLFAATVETAPEFELPEYKKLPIQRETGSVTDADVEKALTALQEQRATYIDLDRAAQVDDYVVVNYTGTSEGKPLTEFSPTARGLTEQKNFWMRIQPDSFVPGFTDQLIGAKAGDRRTVTVEFPDDFVAPKLSGRQGVYEVEVVQIKDRILPELNDEFANAFEAESLERLREGVRQDLQNELNVKQRRTTRSQIIQGLLGRVKFDLPESLVQSETKNVVYDIVKENQDRGIPKEVIDKQKDEIFNHANSSAKDRVKIMFLVHRIAEKEGIRIEQEAITQRILYIAHQNNMKPEKLIEKMKEQGGITEIHNELLSNKVLDFLELNAQVEEVPTPQPES